MELDIETDPKYSGWAPGSTSVSGFAREFTQWCAADEEYMMQRIWVRAFPVPNVSRDTITARWDEIFQHGLGQNWTEKQGYEQVRRLVGPTEYVGPILGVWCMLSHGFVP
jgi:hypothetical protein